MSSGRHVWITRSEPSASRTAARLIAMGHTPVVAPLLAIQPLEAVTLPDLGLYGALAFTSPNGVEAFARLTQGRYEVRDLPAFCVGDATRDGAHTHGFHKALSAEGDIHALAQLIRDTDLCAPLLAPGAREPAGDLPGLLPHLIIHRLPVYAAVETRVPPPAKIDTILIHSPRAALALSKTLAPYQAPDLTVLTISEAAASPLRALKFKEMHISAHPDETSLLTPLGKSSRPV